MHVRDPAERGVVFRERAAGSYRLSAYVLAKTLSDLPLMVVNPVASYTVIYLMTGLYVLFHVRILNI
jgi:hypothetical protein